MRTNERDLIPSTCFRVSSLKIPSTSTTRLTWLTRKEKLKMSLMTGHASLLEALTSFRTALSSRITTFLTTLKLFFIRN